MVPSCPPLLLSLFVGKGHGLIVPSFVPRSVIVRGKGTETWSHHALFGLFFFLVALSEPQNHFYHNW